MIEIISIIVLSLIIITLLVFHIISVKEYNKQIIQLTKLIKAKDLPEFTHNEMVKEEKKEEGSLLDEVIAVSSIYDNEELFDQMIEEENARK